MKLIAKIIRAVLVISAVVGLDQITKYAVKQALMKHYGSISVFPFLDFVYVENRGISFGLFKAGDPTGVLLLTLLSSFISGVFLKFYFDARSTWSAGGFLLIVGGALGNIVDRVRFGCVIDFIDFHVGAWSFPAFNLGDAAITLGAVIVLSVSFFSGTKKR